MATTRRDFLRTATGLVAATAAGGALYQSSAGTAEAKAQAQGVANMNISVQIDGFSGEFAARMAQMGVAHAASIGGAGGGAGKPVFDNLAIEKQVDGYSPLLYMLSASGQHVKEAVLTLRDSQGAQIGSIRLRGVLVAGCNSSFDGSGNDVSIESLTLAYEKIEMSYLGNQFGWDVKANTKI